MNNTCVIYCNGFNQWIVQAGFEIIGRYDSLKGARIAATKKGFNHAKIKTCFTGIFSCIKRHSYWFIILLYCMDNNALTA
jgi:hypothetical protein